MPWFLEKKGKFFGPFRTEKVLAYAAEGRIKKTTRVSESPDGAGARPFGEVQDVIERNGTFADLPTDEMPVVTPEALEEASKAAETQSPEAPAEEEEAPIDDFAEDEADEKRDFEEPEDATAGDWHICTPDRRYGPYSLAHLEALMEQGKLQPGDRLQREGQSHLVEARELFPEGPAKKPEPKEEAPKPATKQKTTAKVTKPKKKTERGGTGRMLAAFLITAVIGAAIIWFQPFDKDPMKHGTMPGGKVLDKIKRQADKVSPLRAKAAKAELPNFNELTTRALAEGIGFHFKREIEPLRANDQKEYEVDGAQNFGTYFPGKIRKEVRYVFDGGFGYTYLVGSDGYVFAVAIDQGGFNRNKMQDVALSDFAPGARSSVIGGRSAYTAEIVKDVCKAHLIWLPDSNGVEALSYIIVEAIPDEPGSGTVR